MEKAELDFNMMRSNFQGWLTGLCDDDLEALRIMVFLARRGKLEQDGSNLRCWLSFRSKNELKGMSRDIELQERYRRDVVRDTISKLQAWNGEGFGDKQVKILPPGDK